jgi:hypothetical protein
MNNAATATPTAHYYTDPNTGRGIPCAILSSDDGTFVIELITGQVGTVTAGDLYRTDESGRYLGGPVGE